ncbi:MAG: hypothetical protein SGARI_004985, partial [Bacillariaceae sp.]
MNNTVSDRRVDRPVVEEELRQLREDWGTLHRRIDLEIMARLLARDGALVGVPRAAMAQVVEAEYEAVLNEMANRITVLQRLLDEQDGYWIYFPGDDDEEDDDDDDDFPPPDDDGLLV